MEVWKGVTYQSKNLSQWYEVSSNGRLRSAKTHKTLRLHLAGKGYLAYCGSLGARDKKQSIRVHKAVAETFIPNPMHLPEVNHKDGIKLNNCIENLEWVTAKENTDHAIQTGLIDTKQRRGEKNPLSKLTNAQVQNIISLYSTGSFTHRQLARAFHIDHSTITRIINHKAYDSNVDGHLRA